MTSGHEPEYKILVVDDEPRGLDLMARSLRKLGSVQTMTDAANALAETRAVHIDLVISDQRMPGMTGVQLLTTIEQESPFTGRILLTGFADLPATRSAINDAKVHAYLSKPCPPDQLRSVASNVIERVRLAERNAELVDQLSARAEELEEIVSSLRKETQVCERRARASAVVDLIQLTEATMCGLDSCLLHLTDESPGQENKVRAAYLLQSLRDSMDALRER